MSSPSARTLTRREVGGLPLVAGILECLGLRELLAEHLPAARRGAASPVDALFLLAINLSVAKDPLYELAGWVDALDLRALGLAAQPAASCSDDRFGRALDKLHDADRASLQTRLVLAAIRAFDLRCDRIHNDSTSVKAFGRIPGRTRTGVELRHGFSKDHRPDLKQLVFSLSLSADGAVPIHHQVYPGNRNDETTHIRTWEDLRALHGRSDFLYVADCKLCTRPQLAHIVAGGGRAITIVPQNLKEARAFIRKLEAGEPIGRKPVWRRPKPCEENTTEYFWLFEGHHTLEHGGYPIHWFLSSEKRKRDRYSREQRLAAAERALVALAEKLNTPRLCKQAAIHKAIGGLLAKYRVEPLIAVRLATQLQRVRLRPQGRPPGQKARYRIRQKVRYRLHWKIRAEAVRAQRRTDGVFPLLCTDARITPRESLEAWKYQPRIERRFEQFKHVHRAAPLLFKKIERVEANLFVFFVALMAQALLERQLRQALKAQAAAPLKLYPEDRDAPHPTTSQLLKTFAGLSTYQLSNPDGSTEEYRDELQPVHHDVLALLGIDTESFWSGKRPPIATP